MENNFIDKVDSLYIKIGEIVSIFFLVVVLIGFFEVVMRYVFDSPTLWVHETTTFIISLSLLYGGVACFAENKHIAMTFIRERFNEKIQWYMALLVEFLVFIFMSMLTYGSYCATRDAFISPFGTFKMQTSGSVLDTPFPALNKGFFFITCIMILFLSVLHIYRHIKTHNNLFDNALVEDSNNA
ncbi:TRAP transporter small permease [Vibrio sp. DW001]|uniref:TRAP transporter small permease subunit n=1 Tax=Vibrio sp. DW001 TaxID=2912315 RepID=UPI0023B0A340|nr:TRAP transporter small permease [Vibrio sp. DW001]WED26755.1 TRAP transporter small permease [Vibrio sp. DW001]